MEREAYMAKREVELKERNDAEKAATKAANLDK